VLSGVKEIREVVAAADAERRASGARTILFVDEIHRFNRAQQDAFLPHVEKGTVILVGATTENPSFEVNAALLSRCRVYVLRGLTEEQLVAILRNALADPERGLGRLDVEVTEEACALIARLANADARAALTILELAVNLTPAGDGGHESTTPGAEGRRTVTDASILEAAQRKTLLYDKSGEEHYNLISALHKSLRDSDPDAALYWMARMLESGEEPLYVARRLVRFASEDVGNADPLALSLTLAAKDAYDFLGSPEGELALARPPSTWPWPPSRTPRTSRSTRPARTCATGRRSPCRCTCATRRRGSCATSGTGRATATPTTRPTPWWTRSTCPSHCASGGTTARSIGGWSRSWRAGSRPGASSARA
jgi:putative ATPase